MGSTKVRMAPRNKDKDCKIKNNLSVGMKSKCFNNNNKKVVVKIPGEAALPHTSFTYTYEVLDNIQPVEEERKSEMSARSGIKIKPLHTLQSSESVTKVVMNNNYTYENTEEEKDEIKMRNIQKTNVDKDRALDLSTNTSRKEKESFVDVADDEIFAPSLTMFSLAKHKKTSSIPPDHIVCEAASRILFQSISWALNIPGLAQCKDQINLENLLEIITCKLQNCLSQNTTSLSRLRQLTNTITKIRIITNSLEEMEVDHTEFAFLRLCSVFLPGQQSLQLRTVTDNIYQRVLSAFEGNSRENFGKIIQLLSILRTFQQDILGELFFSSLIGNVPIDNVIPFIISMKLK